LTDGWCDRRWRRRRAGGADDPRPSATRRAPLSPPCGRPRGVP